MFSTFKSIAHEDQFGYIYDSQSWDQGFIEPRFQIFKTYGRGLTAHSPAWGVPADRLADYLASLAVAMLEDDDDKLGLELHSTICRCPSRDDIEFAASVIYKEPKPNTLTVRYYSVQERKISSSDKKRHDKRYFEISAEHDGSPKSIFRVLSAGRNYETGMDKYCRAEAIRSWAVNKGIHMDLPAVFLQWFDSNRDRARELCVAYDACKAVTEAARLRENARRELDNYRELTKVKPLAPVSQG